MRFCHKQPETSKALILMCNFNTYRSSSKILVTLVLIQRGGAKLRNEENNSGSFEKRRQASNNHKKHRKEIQPQILLVTKPMSSAGIIALAPPSWQIAQIAQIAQVPSAGLILDVSHLKNSPGLVWRHCRACGLPCPQAAGKYDL